MEILENYTNELKRRGFAKNTITVYSSCFTVYLNNFKGKDIRYVSEEHIKNFLLSMLDNYNISPSYQNQLINAIKFYYEQILHQPRKVYYINRPKVEKKIAVILSQDEVRRIFNECHYLKHKAILYLIYSAGLRESEVINLKLSDIDSENMVIYIQQSKGKKDRIVPLSEKTLTLLREYYKSLTPKPETYLFQGQFKEQYSASSIREFLNKYAFLAGIKKNVYPHLLRHCFTTHSYEAGIDLHLLQDVLGHKSFKTTQGYIHNSTQRVAQMSTPDNAL
ncbi:tyrosine-type recombinase/integrase [bacterium]|nr:tyrosine-type recombinase/integrase [bacterium]